MCRECGRSVSGVTDIRSDVAEFYAKRAEQHFNMPGDIAERLRDMASTITGIADVIEEEARK